MKIGIIAHALHAGGGYSLALNFIGALKRAASDEEFLIVCPKGVGYEEIDLPANSELFFYEGSHAPLRRYFFDGFELPKILERYNPDVLFALGNIGLRNPAVPQAVFFHQAYLLYNKRHYPNIPLRSRIRISYQDLQVRRRLVRTDLLLCQSPVVKERFANKYCYPRRQIKIWRFTAPADIKPVAATGMPSVFRRADGYFHILMLTRYLTHRNPSILIPLCKRHGREIREEKIRFITTIESSDHPGANDFLKSICKNHLEDLIINVGHLSRREVSGYLTFSDVFWLPTLLETLCVPYLEAMTVGVPIMAPDLDFARYVCGGAAVYYNPWDFDSVFRNIIMIRGNPAIRLELVRKGKAELQRSDKFAKDWEGVAASALKYLRELAGK